MRDRQAAQGAAVECAFEGHDESSATVLRRHDAIHEDRLDCVFDRLGACVNDEVPRRAGRRDPVQFGFEAEGQDGLIFGMRVARRDEWQRLEDSPDYRRIVLAEGVGSYEGAHVQETVWLAGGVAVNDREIRSHGLGWIKSHRQ